jgi:hypothetical protein
LEHYLSVTGQVLVLIPWGERTLHYEHFNHGGPAPAVQDALQNNQNNLGSLIEYDATA